MEDLVRCGEDAEKIKGDPVLGVKKKPWWPFKPWVHYMVPLLHCEIGVGHQLLDRLQAIINEHIARYSPGEEALITSITTLKRIITATAKERDDWDNSAEGGKKQKIVMRAVMAYSRRREIILENNNEQDKCTYRDNESALAALNLHRTHLVQKLKKARRTLSEQQLKLKVIQTAKGKKEHSVESKMFNVLKKIGVELSSYHGGSLNGKDIKKVMNNASYVFDELAVILKEGKRPGCILPDATLDAMCLHFREVLVRDGAF